MYCEWQGDLLIRLQLLPAHAEKTITSSVGQRDDKRAARLCQQALFTKGQWTGNFPDTLRMGFYGTDFQWDAMNKMLKIPSGKTLSYGQLAAKAGKIGAARAAGSVCSRNPLPFFVPCHRILAANGDLGHYAYGTALKRHLLNTEKQ